VDAHRFRFVFASLPGAAAFQQRCLGNVRRVAQAQARRLRVGALREARTIALRTILTEPVGGAPVDLFAELTRRVFGAPFPHGLVGAWPTTRGDEPRTLLALLTSVPLEVELVETFDVDWFANPKAVPFLRSRASAPALGPGDDGPPDEGAVGALVRWFEGQLG
jgi:hypothetical protein